MSSISFGTQTYEFMCSVCISLSIVILIITVFFIAYPHFAYWKEQITGLIAGLTLEV